LRIAKLFSPSVSLDHGGGSGNLRRFFLSFRQMSVFWEALDQPRQMRKATPVMQIILAFGMATSSAASTGVADLEAAPEVAKTNRFHNKLSNTGSQAFSSMHILEVLGLKNTIAVTYSNDESRFFRPLQ
jgi:hypothetical protein